MTLIGTVKFYTVYALIVKLSDDSCWVAGFVVSSARIVIVYSVALSDMKVKVDDRMGVPMLQLGPASYFISL